MSSSMNGLGVWAALDIREQLNDKFDFEAKEEFKRIKPILDKEGWSVENFEKHCKHWKLYQEMASRIYFWRFWRRERAIDRHVKIWQKRQEWYSESFLRRIEEGKWGKKIEKTLRENGFTVNKEEFVKLLRERRVRFYEENEILRFKRIK